MPSRRLLLLALVLAPLSAHAGAPGVVTSLPGQRIADPGAPAVTAGNLLANERFWPYRVALVRPWKPAGRASALSVGQPGVLIRVESSTRARIDFGRDGVHVVPIGETDLVARADRIRRGEVEKTAPNFVWAIAPRLLDSASPALAAASPSAVADHRAFLCVFADPRAEEFPALARALAPLRERSGIATILFPQGERPDAEVWERLRALHWTVAFVHDHLSEGYTRSLLAEATATPAVLLQTDEGRLLLQRGWSAGVVAELDAATRAIVAAPADDPGSARRGASAAWPH